MKTPTEYFEMIAQHNKTVTPQATVQVQQRTVKRESSIKEELDKKRETEHVEYLWNLYKTKGLQLNRLQELKTALQKRKDKRVYEINRKINTFMLNVSNKHLKIL